MSLLQDDMYIKVRPVTIVFHAEDLAALKALRKELRELRKRDAQLSAMEAAGVDSWAGMGEVAWDNEEEEEEDDE